MDIEDKHLIIKFLIKKNFYFDTLKQYNKFYYNNFYYKDAVFCFGLSYSKNDEGDFILIDAVKITTKYNIFYFEDFDSLYNNFKLKIDFYLKKYD